MLALAALALFAPAQEFPIAVWLQDPSRAAQYKKAGINLYVGLWQGPTEQQLSELSKAQMPLICSQNSVGLKHLNDKIIYGWMHGDEPDNAQQVTDPKTGKPTWGPCIPPATIVADYKKIKAADPTRPVLLNLGQGVANDGWIGRGNGSSLDDYKAYVLGGDIVSFDVYPVAGLGREDLLWYVPKGVERLRGWAAKRTTIWNCLECTNIDGKKAPTPAQVASEAWMAIIKGSRGLIYFVHRFQPRFNEHALLDDSEMLAGVTKLNRQIQSLAEPLLKGEPQGVGISLDKGSIDAVKIGHKGKTYIIAAATRNVGSQPTFDVGGKGEFEVLDENRKVPVVRGTLADTFEPFQVHIYVRRD